MSRSVFQSTAILAACALLFACGKQPPITQPDANGPVITLMPQYPLGFDFAKFVEAEHLQGAPIREAATPAADRRDIVFFGIEGDLHVSVKRDATGREVLNATPFIVPSELPLDDRLAKWDVGVDHNDAQQGRGAKK